MRIKETYRPKSPDKMMQLPTFSRSVGDALLFSGYRAVRNLASAYWYRLSPRRNDYSVAKMVDSISFPPLLELLKVRYCHSGDILLSAIFTHPRYDWGEGGG